MSIHFRISCRIPSKVTISSIQLLTLSRSYRQQLGQTSSANMKPRSGKSNIETDTESDGDDLTIPLEYKTTNRQDPSVLWYLCILRGITVDPQDILNFWTESTGEHCCTAEEVFESALKGDTERKDKLFNYLLTELDRISGPVMGPDKSEIPYCTRVMEYSAEIRQTHDLNDLWYFKNWPVCPRCAYRLWDFELVPEKKGPSRKRNRVPPITRIQTLHYECGRCEAIMCSACAKGKTILAAQAWHFKQLKIKTMPYEQYRKEVSIKCFEFEEACAEGGHVDWALQPGDNCFVDLRHMSMRSRGIPIPMRQDPHKVWSSAFNHALVSAYDRLRDPSQEAGRCPLGTSDYQLELWRVHVDFLFNLTRCQYDHCESIEFEKVELDKRPKGEVENCPRCGQRPLWTKMKPPSGLWVEVRRWVRCECGACGAVMCWDCKGEVMREGWHFVQTGSETDFYVSRKLREFKLQSHVVYGHRSKSVSIRFSSIVRSRLQLQSLLN
ncbi:hypothetical protein BJ508DRAFT_310796 [Ascobolus immersus RN42]|uniref:Uncharacterized protein n=1 Tax=Ascobolus immersus RN42 TaxID=1160509 RepID=A0A3N4HXT2_ASCIM|nr:hypothetical protein BJ508DRAFT_310796 [Ascobolus immersus RN42]